MILVWGAGWFPSGKQIELPLPSLHQMPGHVLYGSTTAPPWGRKRPTKRRREPGDYSLDKGFGHKAGNKAGKTAFPADWSDQQIVDAIRDVLEQGEARIEVPKTGLRKDRNGNEWYESRDYRVIVEKLVEGERIRVVYRVIDGVAVQPSGFPLRRKHE